MDSKLSADATAGAKTKTQKQVKGGGCPVIRRDSKLSADASAGAKTKAQK
jgi:hypothetical protein